MISEAEALAIACDSFPEGAEAVADALGAKVCYSPLVGCEGWCWQYGQRVVIRINNSTYRTRQRFTLAHEIAHVIQGTPSGVLRSEPFRSEIAEERAADKLAAQLLLPGDRVRAIVGTRLPIDAATLTRLAKAANISPITAACRVVGMTAALGLWNAAVAFFDDSGDFRWRYSEGLSFPEHTSAELLQHTLDSGPAGLVRTDCRDGNFIVSSVIDAWFYKALFLQLLPADLASQTSAEERLIEVRNLLFGDDKPFQASVTSCVGHIRNNHKDKTISEALIQFDDKYTTKKWTEEQRARLFSDEGREFLRSELSKSCRPDS